MVAVKSYLVGPLCSISQSWTFLPVLTSKKPSPTLLWFLCSLAFLISFFAHFLNVALSGVLPLVLFSYDSVLFLWNLIHFVNYHWYVDCSPIWIDLQIFPLNSRTIFITTCTLTCPISISDLTCSNQKTLSLKTRFMSCVLFPCAPNQPWTH